MGDAVNHGDTNMVYAFSGGAGGYLRHSGSGRYLNAGGGAHIKVLTSCAEAMGVDFQSFGTGNDKTPFSELGA
jgi:hypothetical protein